MCNMRCPPYLSASGPRHSFTGCEDLLFYLIAIGRVTGNSFQCFEILTTNKLPGPKNLTTNSSKPDYVQVSLLRCKSYCSLPIRLF